MAQSCNGKGSLSLSRSHSKSAIGEIETRLADLNAPSSVDRKLFEFLKNRLLEELNNREGSAAGFYDSTKVTDLAYDPMAKTLSWSYQNEGDYDASGQVGVSDVTPIAVCYLAITSDGLGNDPFESWVDGDGSGEVGVGDITVIATGWERNVAKYRFFTSQTIDGEYYRVGYEVPFGEAGVFPKTFTVDAPVAMLKYLKVAPVDSQGNIGPMSDPVERTAAVYPPSIESVSPLSGNDGTQVTFSAVVSGSAPLDYDWDFGGGADPDNSSQESPVVTLGAAGEYSCSLTVSNSAGESSFPFTLSVAPYNEPPVAMLTVSPPTGKVPLEVSLDARGSSDTDGTISKFEFDLDGNGTFETNNGGNGLSLHTFETPGNLLLAVRVTDNEGATATAAKQITLYEGDNQLPVAALTASAQEGDVPFTVGFDASGSYDPDGTIASYDWNFDGGEWDLLNAGPTVEKTYLVVYPAIECKVRVTDNEGDSTEASVFLSTHGWFDSAGAVLELSKYIAANTSTAFINGLPAICYENQSTHALKFISAYGMSGDYYKFSWNAPNTVATNGYLQRPHLSDIAGNPGILFYERDSDSFFFMRALDSSGTQWGAPIEPVPSDEIVDCSSLACVNGKPAIVFLSEPDRAICFVASVDATGDTWNEPVVVIQNDSTRHYGGAKLIMVNNYPSLVYSDNDNKVINIVCSLDIDGNSWSAPVTAVSGAFAGNCDALEADVIGGNPAIAFTDSYDYGHIWFSASLDMNGNSWNEPVSILSPRSTYNGICLTHVGNIPLLLLNNNQTSLGTELFYWISQNEQGTEWSDWHAISSWCSRGPAVANHNDLPFITYRYYDKKSLAGLSYAYWE
ncbi:MAG: PKD domain-containing protein [bacterium]|jgi:PKD repeat protein